ncbi:unnamed protein product, partial [Heligmosomoides polygyrus]|uniref:Neur_chan_LBD domain-containing protein n=1 Tax=Heligmosomoides polygyrus TaxID=6339 RepID=A0A183FAR7_HELPZ
MYIFPGGEVFMDMRVYLKPTTAEIVLCKYPHDNPACSLKISSLGFTTDAVQFEWFSQLSDAIQLNRDLEIPELTLIRVSAETCDGSRKSDAFSGRVFVSLTVFLTLSAESNSAKEELPKVSYI